MTHVATGTAGSVAVLVASAMAGLCTGSVSFGGTLAAAAEAEVASGHEPGSGDQVEYGIAAAFDRDVGVASSPAVIFTEAFEMATVAELQARWEYSSNSGSMSFSQETPAGSGGSQSVFFSGSADLYTRLLPGHDRLYVRYYAKLEGECNGVHHWPWLGGHSPSTAWPWPRAGTRPVGDERFSTGVEPFGSWWAWAFYTYWMDMRSNPGGGFWGNTFSGKPSPHTVDRDRWICVELMVTMNDPVTARNGEQAFWIDGVKKQHLGPGFPRGEWIWDGF